MAGLEEPWKPLRSSWQTTKDNREKPPYTPPNEVFCASFLNYRHIYTLLSIASLSGRENPYARFVPHHKLQWLGSVRCNALQHIYMKLH